MNEILIKYGLPGIVIIGLITVVKILWDKLNKKDEEHKKERDQDRQDHLNEFKNLFDKMREEKKDIIEVTKTYSKDSRDFSVILKELEMILKNQNKK